MRLRTLSRRRRITATLVAILVAVAAVLVPRGAAVAAAPVPPPLAFQTVNSTLTLLTSSGAVVTGPAMDIFTSPAVTVLPSGVQVAAYQASSGLTTLASDGKVTSLNIPMGIGTSPSIATVPGGTEIAIATRNNTLAYVSPSGVLTDRGLAMAPGTNPSLSANGMWIAYQSAAGTLSYVSTNPFITGVSNLNLPMASGSSPSLALDNTTAGWTIIYVASTGALSFYDAVGGFSGLFDGGPQVRPGTSPSARDAPPSDNTQAAFVSTANVLELAEGQSPGLLVLGPTVAGGTSPSITGLADGTYRIAYQSDVASHGVRLFSEIGGDTGTGRGSAQGTSPALPLYQPPMQPVFP